MRPFAPDFLAAEVRVSPNFGERRGNARIDTVVLHYTGMASGAAAQAWLCNPESQVSSHYIVHEDGRVVQMVREADRAWHAGKSFWAGVTDINSCSVGIEIVNRGHDFGYEDFPDVQVESVISLCRDIVTRHNIPAPRVLAHSDVAPGRKIDPGERFPWGRLADADVGHWVRPVPADEAPGFCEGDSGEAVKSLQTQLFRYGYGVETDGTFGERTRIVVEAFQRHFRPERVDGVADRSTVETLSRLLAALPDATS
ncbi:MAG: N-acetylmuramoyl-L-alanine amidase [Rhizobiaceae bacterium]|nr:N-acetylmuramoyl-L-alanine amidase [Rhizobiaceae bacterium]